MTPRQLQALDFVRERLAAGMAPSYEEIRDHLGLASKSAVSGLIDELVAQGCVERVPGKTRSLKLCGTVDLRPVPNAEILAELARRGLTLTALNGSERTWLGRPRSYGAGNGFCAADGCRLEVQRGHLMCLEHWRALPFELRQRIISTHFAARRSGDPVDAQRYGDAVTEARDLLGYQQAYG